MEFCWNSLSYLRNFKAIPLILMTIAVISPQDNVNKIDIGPKKHQHETRCGKCR
jgi:hypothetical protein